MQTRLKISSAFKITELRFHSYKLFALIEWNMALQGQKKDAGKNSTQSNRHATSSDNVPQGLTIGISFVRNN